MVGKSVKEIAKDYENTVKSLLNEELSRITNDIALSIGLSDTKTIDLLENEFAERLIKD